MNLKPDRHAYSWFRRVLVGIVLIGVVVVRAPSLGARDNASATLVQTGRIDATPRYHDDRRMSHLEGRELLVAVLFVLENKSSSR
jgi:hypothetical protein